MSDSPIIFDHEAARRRGKPLFDASVEVHGLQMGDRLAHRIVLRLPGQDDLTQDEWRALHHAAGRLAEAIRRRVTFTYQGGGG